MIAMTKTRLDVVPLSKHIGAEIRGLDLHDSADDDPFPRSIQLPSGSSSKALPASIASVLALSVAPIVRLGLIQSANATSKIGPSGARVKGPRSCTLESIVRLGFHS